MTRAEAFRLSFVGGHAQMVAWQRMERAYMHRVNLAWKRDLKYRVWLEAPSVSGGDGIRIPVQDR